MSDNNAPPPDAGDSARVRGNQSGRNERYRMVSLGLLVMLLTAGFGIYGYWISVRGLNGAVSQTSKFLAGLSGQGASSQLLVLGPVLALFALVGGLLVRHGLPTFWESVRRSALVGLLLGGCLLGAGLLASGKLQGATRLPWLFFVPIVPPVLLGYQALVVWRQRPRSLGGFKPGVSKSIREALERDGVMERFETTHRQLQQVFGGQAAIDQTARNGAHTDANRAPATNGGAYEPAYFVTNFAVPALLLLLVGFGALSSPGAPTAGALATGYRT